jgi:hypothetical protein
MFTRHALLIALVLTCCSANAATTNQPLDPFVVYGEVARITSEQEVWPGFNTQDMPVAIYDGTNTYLFYHPNPPSGFVQNPDREAIFVYPGRYEAIVANTSIEINGALTATLMLNSLAGSGTMEAAAVLLHEAFHVFQMTKHPDWPANEADSFIYPVDNVDALASRRLESLALQNALDSFSVRETSSWVKLFLELRRQRFAMLPDSSAAYERGIELMEGTANYLQYRMLRAPAKGILPPEEFAADAVRVRAYASGRAQCVLLDRLLPDWKKMLEQGDANCLDKLLGIAVDARSDTSVRQFSSDEISSVLAKAESDVDILKVTRVAKRMEFEAIEGSAIIIDATSSPLMPRGFDPMNLMVLGQGDILHTRYLSLAGTNAKVEIWNHQALTSGAADNPMFGGLKQVKIRGLDKLEVNEKDGVVTITGDGISAELPGSLRAEGETLYITLTKLAG